MYKFIILASAALASAFTTPTTQCTDGCNPIAKPGLNEVVPAGTEYTITWQPTTPGTVSIVLLKGPSTNILPLYAVAEGITNTGTFTWTPASDLEPTGDSGYGFQLINDADGTYQWSTQFGIANEGYSGSASPSGSASASASASPSESASAAGNGTVSSIESSTATATDASVSATVISVTETTAGSSTLSTATITGATTTSSSSSAPLTQTSNGAVALGASFGGAFAAIFAAVAAL